MVHKTPNANRGYRDQSRIDLDKKPTRPKPKKSAQPKKKPEEPKADASEPTSGKAQHPTPWAPEASQEQQLMLDVFRHTFNPILSSPNELAAVLQAIKTDLFARDFQKAFGAEDRLSAYAARWSPTRALCYERVLHRATVELNLEHLYPSHDPLRNVLDSQPPPTTPRTLRVLSIGGGAAELAAVAAFLRGKLQQATSAELVILDSGPWKSVIDKLYAGLTTPPPVSPYANAAAKAAAAEAEPFISADRLTVTFEQEDVLSLDEARLSSLIGDKPILVTICFTLNELFTVGGLAKTTLFLSALTAALPPGSMLLVVDSAGSYSEIGVGSTAKKYPMQWLMDKVLGGEREGRSWTKLEADESVWFRFRDNMDYPIKLENMRHQIHVHRLAETGKPVRDGLIMGLSALSIPEDSSED